MNNAIQVTDIKMNYGKVEALRGISFGVRQGEIFGLIGADGSGKSSMFRILTTLIIPTSGEASVVGLDVVKEYKRIREVVGYMPGRFSLYQDLSVRENLDFFATLFGTTVEQNYGLIEDIYRQIEPFESRPAGKLSGGMKQKLALCCALIHKPQVLFLDEPTTGVDPVSRKEFWGMLKRLRGQGITILVSTPYMDEALLCDRIGLISLGQLLEVNTPQGIIEGFNEPIWSVSSHNIPKLLKDLRANPAVASCFPFGGAHHITFNYPISQAQLMEYVEALGHKDIMITPITATIEDCFMKLESNRLQNE